MNKMIYILIILIVLISSVDVRAQLFYVAPNTDIISTPGLDIQIDGTLQINTSASYTHNGNTHLSGDWENNDGWASASSGTVNFWGNNTQLITGTTSSYFYNITMDKDVNTDRLRVMLPTQVFNNVYLYIGTMEVITALDMLKVNRIITNSAILENFGTIEIGVK